MANSAYIGYGGKARKIKSCYIGVGGVAKKIKKAYIGVGGVAKLCYKSIAALKEITSATQWKTHTPSSNINRNWSGFYSANDGSTVAIVNNNINIYYSSDPTNVTATWTKIVPQTNLSVCCGIAYGNGYWVMVGQDAGSHPIIEYTKNLGGAWTTLVLSSSLGSINRTFIKYVNNYFIVAAGSRTIFYATDPLATWHMSSITQNAGNGVTDIACDGSQYALIGNYNGYAYVWLSANLSQWTAWGYVGNQLSASGSKIEYADGQWCAVVNNGGYIALISGFDAGQNWTVNSYGGTGYEKNALKWHQGVWYFAGTFENNGRAFFAKAPTFANFTIIDLNLYDTTIHTLDFINEFTVLGGCDRSSQNLQSFTN